jgi:hypothetical protein
MKTKTINRNKARTASLVRLRIKSVLGPIDWEEF